MSSNPMSSFPLHAQDQASELRQLAVNKGDMIVQACLLLRHVVFCPRMLKSQRSRNQKLINVKHDINNSE